MTSDLNEVIFRVRLNLDKLRQNRQKEITDLSQIDDELRVAQDYLGQYPPATDSVEYDHACTYVANYDAAITGLVQRSEMDSTIITSGSYILPVTASCIAETHTSAAPGLLNDIETLRRNRNDREVVYEGLKKHNKALADMFWSAWQTLETPAIDPARGPAFLMRETVTQFFHHFAPNDLVKAKKWWKPHDKRTRITRAQRRKFILEERVISARKSPFVELQLEELENLYNDLNKAHTQGQLDVNYIKPLLYRAQDLLKSLLQVIKPPIEWL